MTAPKPVVRLDDPIVDEKGGLTFAGLLAMYERLRFELGMEDSIDVDAVPVQEQKMLEDGRCAEAIQEMFPSP